MIHEFAIDPSILNSLWVFRYFADHVGVHHGRMISRVPEEWEREVLKACAKEQPNKLKTIENRLIEMYRRKKTFYLLGRTYDTQRSWLDNVEAQHQARPFRTIISQANPAGVPCITVVDDIGKSTDCPWNVPRQISVRRSAQMMAQSIALFLQTSSHFIFIDPHFDPRKGRFCRPLEEFLKEAASHRRPIERIEYHVKNHLSQVNNYLSWADFVNECNNRLPQHISQGLQVRFVQWDERMPGKPFHDRYIITDIGGIGFGIGLDDDKRNRRSEVNLHLLDEEKHREIRKDYDYGNRRSRHSTYKFANEVVIAGSKI